MVKRRCTIAAIVALFAPPTAATACSSSSPASKSARGRYTFASTIEPLVREKCQPCHREGGIAPFSLETYEQVRTVGPVARDVVALREMPPWGPYDAPDCTPEVRFAGDLSLTQAQIDAFVRWVDDGMPRGEPAARGEPKSVPSFGGGLVNKTMTLEVGQRWVVEGGSGDELRCFPLDPQLTEDTWVAESIVVPADPRVVHHALVYLDRDHEGVAQANGAESYPCFAGSGLTRPQLLLAWSPAGTSTTYGDGAALLVPKGAHLVVEVHYHAIATSETGRTSLELRTLPSRPERRAEFVLLGNAVSATGDGLRLLPGPNDPARGPAFFIPADTKDHTESMEVTIAENAGSARLAGIGAHMHWAGVGMKVEIFRGGADQGGASECLLQTKYDFDWQRTYAYDAPFEALPLLRGGDTLRITCTYDNTLGNRHIARVTRERGERIPPAIQLGATSFDEMCQAILVIVQ
jgi:hypothetical protein